MKTRAYSLANLLALATTLGVLFFGFFPAQAQGGADRRLRGNYEVSVRRSCVTNNAGFNLDLQPLVDSTTTTASIEGRVRYRGDGTGVYRGRILLINHGFAMASDIL